MYFQLSKTFLSINYIFRDKSSYLSNYLLQHLLLLLDQITLISYELKTYYTCTSYLKMHYFGLPSTIIVTNGVKFWIKYPKSLVSHRQKNLILEPFLDPRWPHRLRHAPKPHCRVVHREVHPRLTIDNHNHIVVATCIQALANSQLRIFLSPDELPCGKTMDACVWPNVTLGYRYD